MKLSKTMRKVGWLAFGLGWIPFATLMLSILSLPAGDYTWSALPLLMRWSIVGVGVCFLVAIITLMAATPVSWLSNRATLAHGLPAEAIILQISDTGETINYNPVVRLLLEVHPRDQAAFQAETEVLISRLQILSCGDRVKVKYDPVRQSVALVEGGDA